MELKIKLETLKAVSIEENNSDEPYLWTIFFQIDGTHIRHNLNILEGDAGFKFTSGSHGNLGVNHMSTGEIVSIPSQIGEWTTNIEPIKLIPYGKTFLVPGIAGVVTVLLEADNVTNHGAEAGHRALNTFVQNMINEFISNIAPLQIFNEAVDRVRRAKPELTEGDEWEKLVAKEAKSILDNDFRTLEETIKSGAGDVVKSAIVGAQNTFENMATFFDPDDDYGSQIVRIESDQFSYSNNSLPINLVFDPLNVRGGYVGGGGGGTPTFPLYELRGKISAVVIPDIPDLFGGDGVTYMRSIGGQISGTPALAVDGRDVRVFARGSSNSGRSRHFFGEESDYCWQYSKDSWSYFGEKQITNSPVALVTQDHRINVFARGADGSLLYNWINEQSAPSHQSQWQSLGGKIIGTPTVSWAADQIHVFVRWEDDSIWRIYGNDEQWSDWAPFWNSADSKTIDSPVALTSKDNLPSVFARGIQGDLIYADAWNSWKSLGGQIKGIPSVVSWGEDRIDVFACGTDNAVWHLAGDRTNWTPWKSLGGVISSKTYSFRSFLTGEFPYSISSVSKEPNHLDIFVRSPNHGVYKKSWNGNAWSPSLTDWNRVTDSEVSTGPIAVASSIANGDLSRRGVRLCSRSKNGDVLLDAI